jgi:hypothetical protein
MQESKTPDGRRASHCDLNLIEMQLPLDGIEAARRSCTFVTWIWIVFSALSTPVTLSSHKAPIPGSAY